MKKILIISSFILVIISISTIGYSIVSANETINEKINIIEYQKNKENYLTPYGYTLDNPNVILDPYGISPLTALIIFETEEEVSTTITVVGKDDNSTYTNTFEETTKHYIPVYGLYPNCTNKVILTCGSITKTIEIDTKPLPKELLEVESTLNESNNLTFITSNTYPYALDNNNEIRWYFTKNYSKKINYLENDHFLLSDETTGNNTNSYGLVEIDLLGKIYKQYTLNTPYLGSYEETDTSIIINSNPKIEIDKTTGTILNTFTKEAYTKEALSSNSSMLPLYTSNKIYELLQGVRHNLTKETPTSSKNIFLIGYKQPNDTYNKYNINIIKTEDNLQVTGDFNEDDEVYLILDKFLDKRVYDVTDNHVIVNKHSLEGKYSIYLKINKTIYKTNNYIDF